MKTELSDRPVPQPLLSLNLRSFQTLLIGASWIGASWCAISHVAVPGQVYAEHRRPAIETGGTTADVLREWGAPEEREEHETRRREVWHYSGGARLTFEEGRLVAIARASDSEHLGPAAIGREGEEPSTESRGDRSEYDPSTSGSNDRQGGQDERDPKPREPAAPGRESGNPGEGSSGSSSGKQVIAPAKTPQSTREILSEIMRQYPDDGVVDVSKNSPPIPPPGSPQQERPRTIKKPNSGPTEIDEIDEMLLDEELNDDE